MESQFLSGESGVIHVARCGNDVHKPTLVFFHGVLRNWRSYYPILSELREDANLVSVDFRGHGDSSHGHAGYRVLDYVEDGCRVLEQIDGPICVYGHSLGAMVAFAVSCISSKAINQVFLEDPPFDTMGRHLPGTALMNYFASVETCLRDYTNNFKQQNLSSAPSLHIDYLFESFSNIIVGKTTDGRDIRIRDTRDQLARQFAAEALTRTDLNVLAPITNGSWLDGFDLIELLKNCRATNMHLLQGDTRMGGMLTDDDCRSFTHYLGNRCNRITFPGVGHSIHWSVPEKIVQLIRSNRTVTR